MGRYYYGDVEGKFWFAVQPSNAADRFGVIGREPNYLEYYFQTDDLPNIEQGLKEIKETLGEYFQKMEDFFKSVDYYNDEELAEAIGVEVEDARYYLREYADYQLGEKIRDYVIEHGECDFTAELG